MVHRIAHLLLLTMLCVLAPCCTQYTRITDIADLPLKQTSLPGMDWQLSPIRANARYVLHGTNSQKEREERLGDYYYVNWYDAQPSSHVRIVMSYTQALTASRKLSCSVEYKEPRSHAGTRRDRFFFNGAERARRGDILTWRIDLYVDGKLVDSRRSFLWQD